MKSFTKLLLLCLSISFITACGPAQETPEELSYDKVILATENVEKQEYQQHHDKSFRKGDKVVMIVTNVGKFEKDPNGFHMLDMSNQLKGPSGDVIFAEKGLLGENGRSILADDMAPNPSTFFQTDSSLRAGEYTATVIIYDLVSGRQLKVSENFILR